MRIGKFEQEILDAIQETNHYDLVLHKVTKWTRNAGERNGHMTWAHTRKVIDRLEKKGLVRVKNRYRTDCKIYLVYFWRCKRCGTVFVKKEAHGCLNGSWEKTAE